MSIKQILPSLLSANWFDLKSQTAQMEKAGIEKVHYDIMDGHFVNNVSFGPMLMKDFTKSSKIKLDAHLMVSEPLKMIDDLIKYEVDSILIHYGTISYDDFVKLKSKLANAKIKLGIVIKPKESVHDVLPYLDFADVFMQMTVEPGAGGQEMISQVLENVNTVSSYAIARKLKVAIQIDGGVNEENISKIARKYPIDLFVVGSAFFKGNDLVKTSKKFENLISQK